MNKQLASGVLSDKELLLSNPILCAETDNQLLSFSVDNQFLHLYPLNIIDYLRSLDIKRPIKLIVKDFNLTCYNSIFSFIETKMSNNPTISKCIEFELTSDTHNWDHLSSLFQLLVKNDIKITFNIKKTSVLEKFLDFITYASFVKLPIFSCKDIGKNILKKMGKEKREGQVFLAKIYLDTNEISQYSSFIKEIKKCHFDYVLITKKLAKQNDINPPLPQNISYLLHSLKYRFEDSQFKIKIVKDLSTLYYPIFTLDERNTKTCYVSKICNYLKDGRLYPCCTKQILEDSIYFDNKKSASYIGTKCLDCASIFENDYLDLITKTSQNSNYFFVKRKPKDLISPIGIGTFKLKKNYKTIYNSLILGQNLIDCNFAYNKGKTVSSIAKLLKKRHRNSIFLYAKIYKEVESIKDIEAQIDEYLKLLKTQSLDIVTIHSFDLVKKVGLLETYRELTHLQRVGKIKQIGACNLSLSQLKELIDNNIEVSYFEGAYSYFFKYYEDAGLLQFCNKHDIKFIAYQSLTMGNFHQLEDSLLEELSTKYNKTVSQILLNYYILYKKMFVLLKSSDRQHILENNQYDFYISSRDYERLDRENIGKDYPDFFSNNATEKIFLYSYSLTKEHS